MQLMLDWLRSLIATILAWIGFPGVLALMAGFLILAVIVPRITKFINSPRGFAATAAVVLGGLALIFSKPAGQSAAPPTTAPSAAGGLWTSGGPPGPPAEPPLMIAGDRYDFRCPNCKRFDSVLAKVTLQNANLFCESCGHRCPLGPCIERHWTKVELAERLDIMRRSGDLPGGLRFWEVGEFEEIAKTRPLSPN